MEFLNQLWAEVVSKLDPISVVLVFLAGFFVKQYMKNVIGATALKTLFVGTVFITIYVIILHLSGELHKEDYMKFFISYCVATSLYEVGFKYLSDIIKSKK